MIVQRGSWKGKQVVDTAVVDGFIAGGDREAFMAFASDGPQKGYSYRDQWWVTHNDHNAFMAMGVFGQLIYIDPTANMVIVKQSSQPKAQNDFADHNDVPAFHALAKHLMKQN